MNQSIVKKIVLVIIYYFFVILSILKIADTVGLTIFAAVCILCLCSLILFILAFVGRWIAMNIMNTKKQRYDSSEKTYKIKKRKRIKTFRKSCFFMILTIIILVGLYYLKQNTINTIDSRIPDSLEVFKEKYPEASQFVCNYPNYKKNNIDIDISKEVEKRTIPLFIQWDKRWGYEEYGDDFFAVTGCGPTALSMVVCGLTGDIKWNPLEVAKFSEQQGYYVAGEGTSWSLMTEGAKLLGIEASNGEVSAEYIKENLSETTPMICSMYPGDFTYTGHFIVLTGIDDEGKIIVNDSNSKINSNKHWDINTILPQIRNLWIYSY